MWISGKSHDDIWNDSPKEMDFFYLKNIVNNILSFLNIKLDKFQIESISSSILVDNLCYSIDNQPIVTFGEVHPQILKYFDIKKEVFYAEFNFSLLHKLINPEVNYTPLSIFPSVKRDLALVVDKTVSYQMLENTAFKYGSNRLKEVSLFDVYEGDKLEAGKKSYALSFVLHHPEKTLTEEEINKVMNKLISAFEKECNAKLR